MDSKKEFEQARYAANLVLEDINQAIDLLKSASNWSLLDIFGGETFTSLIKRNKIRKANRKISDISYKLENLKKELSDISIKFPFEIKDNLSDNLFDIVFDNIITDLRVRGEIKDKIAELKDLKITVEDLIGNLD